MSGGNNFERVRLMVLVTMQEWDMASLGCSDEVKETIFRNVGRCGAGDIGVLHEIGFEILSLGKFKEVSVMHEYPRLVSIIFVKKN